MSTSTHTHSKAQSQSQSESRSKVSLKLVIDIKGKRILYGEAGKNFIDFLFTLFSLPAGTAMNLLPTQPKSAGSLPNLHRSIVPLDVKYFDAIQNKDSLLHPKLPIINSVVTDLLQIEYPCLQPNNKYYACGAHKSEQCRKNYTRTLGASCPECGSCMADDLSYVYGADETIATEGGYVKGMVTYMVMDDLSVKPMSTLSVLKALNLQDAPQIQEKVVHLDMNQGLMLLKASLHSSTVLTDVFLHKTDFSSTQDTGMKRKKGNNDGPVRAEKTMKPELL